MKVDGNGQGKILTTDEWRSLFSEGLRSERDRALFSICLFTGCRVSEALALHTSDIKGGTLTFRKSTTKGKLKTRVVDIQPGLAQLRLNNFLQHNPQRSSRADAAVTSSFHSHLSLYAPTGKSRII